MNTVRRPLAALITMVVLVIVQGIADPTGLLAAEFKNEPMVAGFDLLNEPGFGETAPATTAHQLGKFYGTAIDDIRASDASQIVFIEPSILWSGLGFDSGPTPGFTTDTNIVYPQVAPGRLTKLTAQGADMTLEASTAEPSCGCQAPVSRRSTRPE